MKKTRIILFVMLVCVLSFGCMWFYSDAKDETKEQKFEHALQQKIEQQAKTISFSKLTPFQWDKLYVFYGYARYEEINETLGYDYFELSKWELLSIFDEVPENSMMFVFMQKGKVVTHIETSDTPLFYMFAETGYMPKEAVVHRFKHYYIANKKGSCVFEEMCKEYNQRFK